jgi:glutaredoxin
MIWKRILTVPLLAASLAQAQAYRWTDAKGGVHFSDAPPASAKSVQKADVGTDGAAATPQQVPFELQQAIKDFPVTLYTAPVCKDPCAQARAILNKRGVPFTEVQVWNPETLAELKSKAGSDSVPAVVVGRSAQSGFNQARYDALLDSAGYPKAGAAPVRAQAEPPPPEGYQPPPQAEPAKAEATAAGKAGPYDASGLPANRVDKPGRYDASGLPANRVEKPGIYQTPGPAK